MRGIARTALLACGLAFATAGGPGGAPGPADATVGGPELSEPMGYDPRTRDVYFRQLHWNESDVHPTICRLRRGRGARLFDVVDWSVGEDEDSAYSARVAALSRRLRPLRSLLLGTIPGESTIEAADTVTRYDQRIARYRVHVAWFAGAALGAIHVTTYVDPGVRIVRWYAVPGDSDVIGVVSYTGVPTETGYEQQVPVVVPGEHEELTIPDEWWRTGYPPP